MLEPFLCACTYGVDSSMYDGTIVLCIYVPAPQMRIHVGPRREGKPSRTFMISSSSFISSRCPSSMPNVPGNWLMCVLPCWVFLRCMNLRGRGRGGKGETVDYITGLVCLGKGKKGKGQGIKRREGKREGEGVAGGKSGTRQTGAK